MSSLINIFDFPDDADPPVVYLENDTDIMLIAAVVLLGTRIRRSGSRPGR